MLKAPFPYFGGKTKAAALVWSALGNVAHYVVPFAGSLATIWGRPHPPRMETVNDIDHYIANFWRALQHDPAAVAHYANNPVNEADLTARHIWLVNSGKERIARILGDPDYYDAKVAGWWVWGLSAWIGSGWCSGKGPWNSEDGKLVKRTGSDGVNKQLPALCGGRGINRSSLIRDAIPAGTRTGEAEILAYLDKLATRLRNVRVVCGDWKRVVTRGALSPGREVGIFLDPPYDIDFRADVYNSDAERGHISTEVREWCIANQDNPRYRIVLAGYEGEHDLPGWRAVEWTAGRSYGTATSVNDNPHKERLWLSPHCLEKRRQMEMF